MEAMRHIETKTVKTISLEDQMREKLYRLEAGKRDHVRQRRLNRKKIVVLQSWLFLISLYAVATTIGLGLYRFGLA
jgi:hypothetical protein